MVNFELFKPSKLALANQVPKCTNVKDQIDCVVSDQGNQTCVWMFQFNENSLLMFFSVKVQPFQAFAALRNKPNDCLLLYLHAPIVQRLTRIDTTMTFVAFSFF
jgi:hypothetical protein